jgi:hypothetical protein
MKENTTPQQGYPLLFLIGFITAIASFIALNDYRHMRNIEKNGQLAAMHTDSVIPARQKEPPKLYLSYKRKTYIRELKEKETFLYTKGNKVKVKYIPGNQRIILPSDKPSRYMLISGFFAGIGSLIALFNFNAFWRKIRKGLQESTSH